MPRVVLSMNYIQRLNHLLNCIRAEIREVELVEYDLEKAMVLERQIQRLESVIDGLKVITKEPEKYIIN